ncbi:UDP-N-acetylglucosamine 2-epimerase (non-hydrolyzing) [Caulobacter sp. SLTY]|uniref:non-hydrolyzing UDP-N-acetylglucosamine 2-epimerase n=1 Tax=Caulobacter sp. SLTY TaxID=2683262 RepID=UPI00141367F3|nr:UDP-N-acetylglucosamine 2-epimerase (non-hydrolyzing) [Caulobacter sp. SLTY]
MRVAIVAGTRPEVVKLAPVRAALAAKGGFTPVWISTEQQAALNRQALDTLGIAPDVALPAPANDASLAARFAHVMDQLDRAYEKVQPDLVVVQGDTSSTAAGAMAAFARRLPVAHVEAGLRTFDLASPFPEEGWRCVVGQLAELHFAPTGVAAGNLTRQGVADSRVFVTGNTGVDSVRLAAAGLAPEPATEGLRRIMVTLHRRENWGEALENVLGALLDIRDHVPDVEIVFVAHANPALRQRVFALLEGQARMRVIGPLEYTDFLRLLKSCVMVMSDSGGVQEEAPVFGVPVLVLRESTERMEAVTAGVARLAGVSRAGVAGLACLLLTDEAERQTMARALSPFGDGYAAERIVEVLTRHYAQRLADDPISRLNAG